MFKSQITQSLYKEFINSFQLNKTHFETPPFVFVDPDDEVIRYVAQSYSFDGEGFGALTIEGEGELEYLTTGDA